MPRGSFVGYKIFTITMERIPKTTPNRFFKENFSLKNKNPTMDVITIVMQLDTGKRTTEGTVLLIVTTSKLMVTNAKASPVPYPSKGVDNFSKDARRFPLSSFLEKTIRKSKLAPK